MNSARFLVVIWGDADPYCASLRVALASVPEGNYDIVELGQSVLPSEEKAGAIVSKFELLEPCFFLLVISAGAVGLRVGEFFQLLRSRNWHVPVLVLCADAGPEYLADLLRLGATDILCGPLNRAELLARLSSRNSLSFSVRSRLGLDEIIGNSDCFVSVIKQIPAIARFDASVLILGETGTGKEIVARAIHRGSARVAKPFVAVNCGAIPTDLLENEFFGHENGAFTSANSSRRGVIHEAHGGSLFLDEVDCLPPLAQVKLLRFLQDGHFRPLGSERNCTAEVRVLAASNTDINSALETNRLRRDLYYRLNVITLNLPPLRRRQGDIPVLAHHFLQKYTAKFGVEITGFSPEALQKLASHTWPGNVRELENVIQRAVVLAQQSIILPQDICTDGAPTSSENQNFRDLKAKAIADFERDFVRQRLHFHNGNITKAAQSAGKDRRAFWELMRKHNIPAH
jgi:two-component system response regulator GlrR